MDGAQNTHSVKDIITISDWVFNELQTSSSTDFETRAEER